jgi:hypothetical protein
VPLDNTPDFLHENVFKPSDERAPFLREYLVDRDVPCPACNYNLRGLQTTACPECAQPLVLRVALAEPHMGRFLAAVIGLAVGFGFQSLLLIYWLYVTGFRDGNIRAADRFLAITLTAALIEGLATFLLLRRRGWFQRSSRAVQHIIIALCWILTAAGFILFARYVR